MGVATVRGGFPLVERMSIDTTGRAHRPGAPYNYLKIRVLTNPCKVYFKQSDFAAGNTKYILVPIPAVDAPYGEWEGPCEGNEVWLQGSGGSSTVELVAFQRRG